MGKKEETKEVKKKTEKAKLEKNNKEEKTTKKAKNTKNESKRKTPKESYFAGVKSEMSKVKWPTRKEVLKYTIATITFVIILVLFFILMSLIMSGVKGAFN